MATQYVNSPESGWVIKYDDAVPLTDPANDAEMLANTDTDYLAWVALGNVAASYNSASKPWESLEAEAERDYARGLLRKVVSQVALHGAASDDGQSNVWNVLSYLRALAQHVALDDTAVLAAVRPTLVNGPRSTVIAAAANADVWNPRTGIEYNVVRVELETTTKRYSMNVVVAKNGAGTWDYALYNQIGDAVDHVISVNSSGIINIVNNEAEDLTVTPFLVAH